MLGGSMKESPHFSIITPSLNMVGHLRRCHASIADQADVRYEHIVVDGISDDGTRPWLKENDQEVVSIVERDEGMYDAINKGMAKARGDFIGYLNCDEQYLPATLANVKAYFDSHPATEMLLVTIWSFGKTVRSSVSERDLSQDCTTSRRRICTCSPVPCSSGEVYTTKVCGSMPG